MIRVHYIEDNTEYIINTTLSFEEVQEDLKYDDHKVIGCYEVEKEISRHRLDKQPFTKKIVDELTVYLNARPDTKETGDQLFDDLLALEHLISNIAKMLLEIENRQP